MMSAITSFICGIALFSGANFCTPEPQLGLSVFQSVQGGTGTSSSPVAGDLLMSWKNGSYGPTALIAGSNITISPSTYKQITISSTASGASGGSNWQFSGTTAITPTTTVGILVNASSTIGNGTQAGGLTVSGGATTTGNQYIAGTLGIGTPSPSKTFETIGTGRFSSTLTLGTVLSCNGGQALQTNPSGD